jgi:hypothetical protein
VFPLVARTVAIQDKHTHTHSLSHTHTISIFHILSFSHTQTHTQSRITQTTHTHTHTHSHKQQRETCIKGRERSKHWVTQTGFRPANNINVNFGKITFTGFNEKKRKNEKVNTVMKTRTPHVLWNYSMKRRFNSQNKYFIKIQL